MALAVLRVGDNVVDVGANIGTFSLVASAIVGSSGKVLAFEPNPRIFKYMHRNLELNAITNVCTYNTAIAAESGSVSLQRERVDSMSFISPDLKSRNHHARCRISRDILVRAESLDVMTSSLNTQIVRLVKIDTEGAEALVLEGAIQIMKRTECLLIEVDTKRLARFHSSPKTIYSALKDQGFIIKLVRWKADDQIRANTFDGDWFCYRQDQDSLTTSKVLELIDLPSSLAQSNE